MKTSTRRRQRRQQGTSLVETMIAMSMLSFGLLGMIAVQAKALQQGAQGKQSTAGLAVARDVLEQMPRLPFSTFPADDTWTAAAWIQNTDAAGSDLPDGVVPARVTDGSDQDHDEQLYRVWYRVSDDPSTPANPRVRQVEIEVIWGEGDDVSTTPDNRTIHHKVATLSGFLFDNDL